MGLIICKLFKKKKISKLKINTRRHLKWFTSICQYLIKVFFFAFYNKVCNTTLCDCKGQKGRRGDVCPSGFPGVEGPPGDIGVDGPVGPKGDYGDSGEFGAQGEKGFRV